MKIDFKNRLYQLELLDNEIHDYEEIKKNFDELVFINKHTGGSNVTFSGLKQLLNSKFNQSLTIVDIGFGAGDFLNFLTLFKIKNNLDWTIIGLDILKESEQYALEKYPILKNHVVFVVDDYNHWLSNQNSKIDIITASLFCHHLTDQEFKKFIQISEQKSNIGFIINDLHRHSIAYYFIKLMCFLFSKSEYTKNDAPISVLKGFKRKELKAFFSSKVIIQCKWAFRFLIIHKK